MDKESIMQMVKTAAASSSTSDTMSVETLDDYGLGGVDCPICGNSGRIIERGPSLLELHVTECPCMNKRRSIRSLRKAGMLDMAARYTFDSFESNTKQRQAVKEAALRYAASDTGWFFISGQSGGGKTHICTAICVRLMETKREIYFMPWRNDSTSLKTGVTDRQWYEAKIKKLTTVPVLYIDDFFKGKVTEADVNLAFEILNTRYNDTFLRTIISSELSADDILRIDEAVGGRIVERARGFIVRAPGDNWRLH